MLKNEGKRDIIKGIGGKLWQAKKMIIQKES